MLKSLLPFIKDYLRKGELIREQKSRFESIRVQSKGAIALLRRGNEYESRTAVSAAESLFVELHPILKKNPFLLEQGMYSEAVEEYAEAKYLGAFLTGEEASFPKNILLTAEQNLSGICDATGELVRRAVTIAHPDRIKEIEGFRDITEEVVRELSRLPLSKKMRSKYDDSERNLRRIEEILYDLRLIALKTPGKI